MVDMSSMLAGDKSGWPGGQATVPVTDLSPHVDGGSSAVNVAAGVAGTDDQRSVMYGGIAVVLGAVALLWFFGAFAFRGLPSI